MAEYVVSATDSSEPLDTRNARVAAEELRTLKSYIQTVLLPKVQAVKIPSGMVSLTYRTSAPAGWVLLPQNNDVLSPHIGNASSGATIRANADCADLFAVLWAHPATQLYSSGGATLGKGGSASEDFANNRAISFPPYGGRVPAFPAKGTSFAPWIIAGSDSLALATENIPDHTHPFSVIAKNTDASGSGGICGGAINTEKDGQFDGTTAVPYETHGKAFDNRQNTVYFNYIVSL